MRVYGYLRDSAAAFGALDHQREEVARYADVNGLRVAEMLVDPARPATLPLARRDGGGRLLRLLHPGDAVITPAIDSMFPSAGDAFTTLAALRAERIALHMIDVGCDVCREPVAQLVVGLLGALSRSERGREAENDRALKRHLARQRLHRGGAVPFGFDAVKGRLVPKPEEYDLLRRMIALRTEGLDVRRIAREVGLDEKRVRRIFGRSERLIRVGGGAEPARRASKGRTALFTFS